MTKILIIDTGTAKTGIATIIDGRYEESFNLAQPDPISKDKLGNYRTTARIRTQYKSQRSHYRLRRERLCDLIEFMVDNELCPFVPKTTLRKWRNNRIPPIQFLNDFIGNVNPYEIRSFLINNKIDMNSQSDRYMFGRALYFIVNARGYYFRNVAGDVISDDDINESFYSENINDSNIENNEDSKKKKKSSSLSMSEKKSMTFQEEIESAGFKYISEFFAWRLKNNLPVRRQFIISRSQVKAEFNAICEKQGISDKMKNELEYLIFGPGHRKFPELKRANCPFEKNRKVCFDSHPSFEEYRMWQTIRSIKVQDVNGWRPLNDSEVEKVIKLFYKYKGPFKFSNIQMKLKLPINYKNDQPAAPCSFSMSIAALISPDNLEGWKDEASRRLSISLKRNVSPDEAADIIWHECFRAFREERDSILFFKHKLFVDDYASDDIMISDNTTSVSKEACQKITYWMREYGLNLAYATKMVNMKHVIKMHTSGYMADEVNSERISTVAEKIKDFSKEKGERLNSYITGILNSMALDVQVTVKELDEILWNHSSAERYPHIVYKGVKILPMPSVSIGNPGVYSTMCMCRRFINYLLLIGKIDRDTIIIIESGRQTNTINERIAQDVIQRENCERRMKIEKKCKSLLKSKTVDEHDILLYELWEETGGLDLWTGKMIPEKDILFGQYDDEHTYARARGGHNTKDNMTISDAHFNQRIKKNLLPMEVPGIEDVQKRAKSVFGPKIAELEEKIEKNKNKAKFCKDPDRHQKLVVERLVMTERLEYFQKKLNAFWIDKEIVSYADSQAATNDYTAKQIYKWMKTVFHDVRYSRAEDMTEARDKWSVPKNRDNNYNHAEDAFIHGCLVYYGLKKEDKCPYPEFYEDLEKLHKNTLTLNKEPKAYGRLMKEGAYKHSIHKDSQYSVNKDKDGNLYSSMRMGIKDILLKKKIDLIVDPEIRKCIRESYDAGERNEFFSRQGNIIRHARVYQKMANVENMVKVPFKVQTSDKEYKNYRYYVTDGCSCAGYYSNGIFCPLGNNDETKGETIPKTYGRRGHQMGELLFTVRNNDMVVLFRDDETPDIFENMSREDFFKRLFKVDSIEKDGRIRLSHHDYNSENKQYGIIDNSLIGRQEIMAIRTPKINCLKVDKNMRKRFLKF